MKNIKENGLERKVLVYPVAVGSYESLVTFYGASTGGSLLKGWNQQTDHGITVAQHSLDNLVYQKIAELKVRPLFLIDVEGAEFDVVKGANKIINHIPEAIFCIEIPCREFMPDEKFNPHFIEIFEYFLNLDFYVWEIDDSGECRQLDRKIIRGFYEESRFDGVMAVFSKNNLF